MLATTGPDAPAMAEKLRLLGDVRGDAGVRETVDRLLIERLMRHAEGLAKAETALGQLTGLMDRLSAPPWLPAVVVRLLEIAGTPQALVAQGSERRLVTLFDGVTTDDLQPGDEVFLSHERNAVMARADGPRRTGETARFARCTDDGRLVLTVRDEEMLAVPGGRLTLEALQEGDRVLWDSDAAVALERIAIGPSRRFLLGTVPDVPLEAVGGLDDERALLVTLLTAALIAPDVAALYGLDGRGSILLVGPNGVGKTLLVKAAVAELQRRSGRRCWFAVVKPAEWTSPYVGETEANIRECFAALREAARDGIAVVFFDEVEALGRTRGHLVGQHDDRFLAALLAELDGFEALENVIVVSATNRKDLMDAALLERLSDVEIAVPRPTRDGARRIAELHLPASVPCADDRDELLSTMLSALYAPNGGGELSRLRFRDGRERVVRAHEMMSGRTLKQICRTARLAALRRHLDTGDVGVQLGDVEAAVHGVLARLATTITRTSASTHIADLPQDVDVVSAVPLRPRLGNPRHYLRAV